MARDADRDSRTLSTLVALVRLGAAGSYTRITSGRLGESLGVSQQASSGRLTELERAGLIERVHSGRGLAVRLTEDGLRAVKVVYSDLRDALDGGESTVVFRGRVFTGFGEGGYYVSLKGYSRQFQKSLGFVPFPGTLNLKLSDTALIERRRRLEALPGVEVQGFKDGRRTFGPVKCFRARVAGHIRGAVLAIERTHYDSSVLEVIAPMALRGELGVKDGDECAVTVYLK